MDLNEIKELIALMDASLLSEIEVEDADQRIHLKREITAPTVTVSASRQAEGESAVRQMDRAEQKDDGSAYHHVTSPIVGTFYKAPSPAANPYVEVGDLVKKGQVLCVVEAMKLMNEIESDIDGRVVKICIEDGAAVEYGELLVAIESA